MADDLTLRPAVAEAYKLVKATPATQVSHPRMGVIRLADINLDQAALLVADGCKLIQPIKKDK